MFDTTNVNAFSDTEQMKGGSLLNISNLEKIVFFTFTLAQPFNFQFCPDLHMHGFDDFE